VKSTGVGINDSEELEKDLAYMTISVLDNLRGNPIVKETEQKIIKSVRDVIIKDPRVDSIQSIDISPNSNDVDSPINEYDLKITLQDNIQTNNEVSIEL